MYTPYSTLLDVYLLDSPVLSRSCHGDDNSRKKCVLLLTELLQKSEDVRIICPVFMSLFTHLSQLEETSYHQCLVGNTSDDSVWGFPDVELVELPVAILWSIGRFTAKMHLLSSTRCTRI